MNFLISVNHSSCVVVMGIYEDLKQMHKSSICTIFYVHTLFKTKKKPWMLLCWGSYIHLLLFYFYAGTNILPHDLSYRFWILRCLLVSFSWDWICPFNKILGATLAPPVKQVSNHRWFEFALIWVLRTGQSGPKRRPHTHERQVSEFN